MKRLGSGEAGTGIGDGCGTKAANLSVYSYPSFGQGVQYCSGEYVDIREEENLAISMTRSGSPHEIALAERLYGTVKNDFFPKRVCQKHKETGTVITKFIETYNRKRPHASLDYFTPDQAQAKEGKLNMRRKHYPKRRTQKEDAMKDNE